jgi:predicted MFS family arabinose efflux permease
LPLFLYTQGWTFAAVGGFLATWTIAYGMVQASAPAFVGRHGSADGRTAALWAGLLALTPLGLAAALAGGAAPDVAAIVGLALFGLVFAVNSAVHSYLIVSYADLDKVTMDVGFYYSANAAGRLVGTVLSGLILQLYGFVGCLAVATVMALAAAALALPLPVGRAPAGMVAASDSE